MNEKQLSKIKPEHRRAFAEVCQHSEDGYEVLVSKRFADDFGIC